LEPARTASVVKVVKSNWNIGKAQPPKSPIVRKSQSLQDQQFEERLHIAERLVQALREAGYSCGLADDVHARALQRED
jgi:hypothetical protein